MDGFKVNYISKDGKKDITWFGMPEASFDISKMPQKEIVGLVSMFFCNAHSGCTVISIESCKYEDYKNNQ